MTFTPASAPSLLAFDAILLYVLAALPVGVYVASRRRGEGALAGRRALLVLVGAVLWLALLSLPVASGALEAQPVPRLMIFFLSSVAAGLLLSLSPVGGWLATGLPLWALVGFQCFRFPLELVLHAWALGGTVPFTMTWDGVNYDIVSGLLALGAAPLSLRFPVAARAFNVVGLGLLGNVARVAILSSPVPFGWPVSPPLELAFHLPYAFIIPVCVAGALAGHVVLARATAAARTLSRSRS